MSFGVSDFGFWVTAFWGIEERALVTVVTVGCAGGPVFVERQSSLELVGIYNGLIYPEGKGEKDKTTALGTFSNLGIHLAGHSNFVRKPSLPMPTVNVKINFDF